MKIRQASFVLATILILAMTAFACSVPVSSIMTSVPTDTPQSTVTFTLVPTNTPRPSPTLRPTRTPNFAATERIKGFNAETQSYFDKGYLTTTKGKTQVINNYNYEWAQIDWYRWISLSQAVSDFYISAHFKWSSAFRNANPAGCGVVFAVQSNGDHYGVFLDRSSVVFLNKDQSSNYSQNVGLTRGSGRVKFDNPADHPVEADFTLIVNGGYAYVLVNGEVVGEYSLAQSKILKGDIGLSTLSGINKSYGTRCEMTNIRVWTPDK